MSKIRRNSKKITPRPDHQSLKALPKLKGGYYRRVKDIDRALKEAEYDQLPPFGQFLCLYFACEKLALAIMGVDLQVAAEDAYGRNKFVLLDELKTSASTLGISITEMEIDLIFGDLDSSARGLRHKVVHDFGPSNIKAMKKHCGSLIPVMKKFLACTPSSMSISASTSDAISNGRQDLCQKRITLIPKSHFLA